MNRSIAIVGAPSSIGIRPYDSGEARQLDRAPGVLRELCLVQRLGASDLGDVIPPAYRDYIRPLGRVRNEGEVPSANGWRRQPATDALPSCWGAIAALCLDASWVRDSQRKNKG
jgi:hypothetical protein